MSKIIDNLMDILLIGGKLIISYIRDFYNTLALLWKEDHLTPLREEDDFIWNGGVTNNPASRIDDTNENNTLVYDEYSSETQERITYDGIMGEIDD
tara:strand:- start:291 stop:578 length:288 start_codon:yes stop_codon:yes gene_type:complete